MLQTVYNFYVSKEVYQKNLNRLINQLWKLIPMRENEENWKNQLNTVILEVVGLEEIMYYPSENFLILLSKLNGLNIQETSFPFYRKTVFECISLLKEL